MGSDHGAGTRGEPRDADADHPTDDATLSVLKRYAAGKISARQASYEMGPGATEHDVYVGTLRAGLRVPSPPKEVIDAEVAALGRLFGTRAS